MDKITSTKLIIVEGKDDERFIDSLIKYLGINDVQIVFVEGKSRFRTNIQALRNTPGFDALSIYSFIRDSDSNPPISAFTSIRNSLIAAGITPPEEDQSFSDQTPRVGIFIMPGNGKTGAIEDLCLSSIAEDSDFICVEDFFECIGTVPREASKAKIQCYLSGKDPLANSLGYAAFKGHWDYSKPEYEPIINFLSHYK